MRYLFLLIAIVISSLSIAQNGLEIVMEQKVFGSDETVVESEISNTIWLTDTKIRMISDEVDEPEMIFDSEKEKIILIIHDKKEYVEITEKELQEINAKLVEARKMMESRLSMVPEAQRKMMEDQMGSMYGGDKTETVYEKVDAGVKIGSYSTSKIRGTSDGILIEEIYLASMGEFNVSKDNFKVLFEMSEFMNNNMSMLQSSDDMSFISENDPSFKEGIPVKTISYYDGIKESEEVMQKISHVSITDDSFLIPAGYKKIEFTKYMETEDDEY